MLALSDLGALAVDRFDPLDTWLALGRLYRESRARPIALVPCDVGCIPLEAMRDWIVVPWESHVASRQAGLSSDQVDRVAQRVLTLLSYALRLEPILIREVRRMLVKGCLGAGIEARVSARRRSEGPSLRGRGLFPPRPENSSRASSGTRRQSPGSHRRCSSVATAKTFRPSGSWNGSPSRPNPPSSDSRQ